MSDLVQELLAKLATARSPEDLDGWIWKVGDLIAKTTYEVYHSGFREIDEITVSAEQASRLKESLLAALKRNPEACFVGQILDCLGMTNDPTLKPLYVEYLERYLRVLKDCNRTVYSCLNALDRLEENVYETEAGRSTGQSLIEIDKNVRQANRYLASQGITQSW